MNLVSILAQISQSGDRGRGGAIQGRLAGAVFWQDAIVKADRSELILS